MWKIDPHPHDPVRGVGDILGLIAPGTAGGRDQMTDRERHLTDAASGVDMVLETVSCPGPGCTRSKLWYGRADELARIKAADGHYCPDHRPPDDDEEADA